MIGITHTFPKHNGFSLEYLAASIGQSDAIKVGADVIKDEQLEAVGGIVTLSYPAQALGCNGTRYVWYKTPSDDEYTRIELTGTETKPYQQFNAPTQTGTYCVKYIFTDESARRIVVDSQFIPDTLYVILTTNLYAGDASSSSGTKVGEVVIKVPRFQLDGSQDLSMNMTGASTTSLKGSALATDACGVEGCDQDAYYAEIIEILTEASWLDDMTGLAIDEAAYEGEASGTHDLPDVYALFPTMVPKKITSGALEQAGSTVVSGTTTTTTSYAFAYSVVSGSGSIDSTEFTFPSSGTTVFEIELQKTITVDGVAGTPTTIASATFTATAAD